MAMLCAAAASPDAQGVGAQHVLCISRLQGRIFPEGSRGV